jgi:predicted porin
VNTNAVNRTLAVASLLLTSTPVFAEQYGPLEVVGFLKNEYSFCDNCSSGLVNRSAYDPRGVLSPPVPMVNQGGDSETTGRNLFLMQLTLGLSHEFDNAFKIEAKTSGRMRNTDADIYDNWMTELYAGVSHPTYGSLQVGKMTSRAWSRSDDFAYPMGLSSPWAESGAGYGLFPEAVRYATRDFEIPIGKIRFEASYAEADTRKPLNPSSLVEDPPDPSLYEIFIQYSNEKNLIELIYQDSEGGRQSSFQKGAFYGAQGNTNGLVSSPDYEEPSQNVVMVQGNYWMNQKWKFTYGLRRSEWSGQAQQCDFGPVSVVASACFWDQPGFNYSDELDKVYSAVSWDGIVGASYTQGKWTYTAGGVYLDKASTDNPVEWGQDNTAIFLNLGIYRDLPELSFGGIFKAEVYGGFGHVRFGREGPAPLSMPNNIAFGGVDPRISESGNFFTIGANLNF